MFRGINLMTMDAKGRVALPTRYRDLVVQHHAGAMVVTIDTEETCLLLYPRSTWQVIEERLQNLPSFNPVSRRVQRLLIGHATDVELDASGRLLVSPELRAFAQLEKRVVMIGQGNKFEVWDETLWQTRRQAWLAEEASHAQELPDEMKMISL